MIRRIAMVLAICMFSAQAAAAESAPLWLAAAKAGHQRPVYPSVKKPSGSLRAQNITDDEVREIQQVLSVVSTGELVNISGVIAGCSCEEDDACTDQVWVVLHKPNASRGLSLSRTDGHWQMGRQQQWLLEYEQMAEAYARLDSAKDADAAQRHALMSAYMEHLARYPACNQHEVSAVR